MHPRQNRAFHAALCDTATNKLWKYYDHMEGGIKLQLNWL